MESFNGKLRDELLARDMFYTLTEGTILMFPTVSPTALARSVLGLVKHSIQEPERARSFRSLLRFHPWRPEYVRCHDGLVEVRGWALAPDGHHSAVSFAMNGAPFHTTAYPLDRPDIERLFWYVPYARASGFECRTRIGRARDVGNPLVLQYVDERTGAPLRCEHTYYVDPDSSADLPLPDGARVRRVQGGDSPSAFLLEGFCNLKKLEDALRCHVGRTLTDFRHLLDFGCGCGRLIRHLQHLSRPAITGIDVDADAVEWCADHLPYGAFLATPLHPPTDLPTGVADLIVGLSVFTHLREPEQDEWLAELKRLAAPDAILLLTTHGDSAVCREAWYLDALRHLQQDGRIDGENHDLDGIIAEPVGDVARLHVDRDELAPGCRPARRRGGGHVAAASGITGWRVAGGV